MKLLLDTLPVGVWIAGPDARITRYNPRVFEIWGGGPEMQNMDFSDFQGWWADSGRKLQRHEWAAARALLEGEPSVNNLIEIEPFNGGPHKFILNSAAPLRDASGAITGAVITNEDVSPLIQARQAKEESERRYRAFFNRATMGAALAEASTGRLQDTNDKFCELTGYSRSELLTMRFIDLVHPDDRDLAWRRYTDLLEGRVKSYQHEKRALCKDGRIIWVQAEVGAVRDSDGHILYTLALMYDITDRKVRDEQLKRNEAELSAVNTALSRSNQELQQFAYVISHDLQEPLRTIRGCGELLARKYRDAVAPEDRELLTFILAAGERMHNMVVDLLAYSRVERGYGEYFDRVELNEVLEHAISNLQQAITDTAAVITYPDLPRITGDYGRLAQLLQNLIGNSIKYCRSGVPPKIEIEAVAQGKEWIFSVRDNGIGIDPKHHSRIFGIFKRLHGHDIPGTGMGLAICKKIVERHGGRIWVESASASGSTFFFTIPFSGELPEEVET